MRAWLCGEAFVSLQSDRHSRPITFLLHICAGMVLRLANRAVYQALLTWRAWAAERADLRLRLQSALSRWRQQALALAFDRLRRVLTAVTNAEQRKEHDCSV